MRATELSEGDDAGRSDKNGLQVCAEMVGNLLKARRLPATGIERGATFWAGLRNLVHDLGAKKPRLLQTRVKRCRPR